MARNPLLHPVGPASPRVYWARRGVLLAVVLVVVVLVLHACTGGSSPSPHAGGKPASTPEPTHTPAPVCAAADLNVVATTDAETYPAGVEPQFTASVTNNSGKVCRLRVGASERIWSVTSGSDEVWTTEDCQQAQGQSLHDLKPGHSVTYTQVWNRQRSSAGCPSPSVAAQPGTYLLTVTIDGQKSPPTVFHLTS